MLQGKKLELLFDTIRLLNSSRDTDYILRKLLKDALDMTPGADAGIVFLWDEEIELLVPKTYQNMASTVEKVMLKSGESMTGQAFEKRETLFFRDREEVFRSMNTMEKRNLAMATKAGIAPEHVKSSICCPLLFRDEPIGVMVVDNLGESPLLTDEDVEFITLISEQATTAIANSLSYAREKRQQQLLEEQVDNQQKAEEIHIKLTQKILNGTSEGELLETISQLTGENAFILDKFGGLKREYFGSEKAKNLLFEDLEFLKERLEGTSGGPGFHRGFKQLYLCYAIMVKKETMGYLCLASNQEFCDINKMATERMASILALHYLKEFEVLSKEVGYRSDMLDRAMLKEKVEDRENFMAFYSIPRNTHYRILLFQVEYNPHIQVEEKEKRITEGRNQLFSYLESLKEEEQADWFVSIYRRRVFLLLFDQQQEDETTFALISKVKKSVLDRSEVYGDLKIKIGFSSWIDSLEVLKEAHEEAQYILFSEQELIDLSSEKIILLKVLRSMDKKDAYALIHRVLGPLEQRQELMETILGYVQHQGKWKQTKEALSVHGNTLTYRLRKIESLVGLHVKEYPDRLLFDLACELHLLWPEALQQLRR